MDQREEKQVQSKGEGEGMQTPHKRRVRYKGTHPRIYQEKYKELNPEKYKDTVERVIQKGGTPAGMHISMRNSFHSVRRATASTPSAASYIVWA